MTILYLHLVLLFFLLKKSLFDVKLKENRIYLRNQNTKPMTTILNHQKLEATYNFYNRVIV